MNPYSLLPTQFVSEMPFESEKASEEIRQKQVRLNLLKLEKMEADLGFTKWAV